MASRYCRVCKDFHDLDMAWPSACYGHFGGTARAASHQVVKDIEPYRSTITGERIAGRRQHRDHLRAHGCIEVGNEWVPPKPPEYVGGVGQDIRKSMEQMRGR